MQHTQRALLSAFRDFMLQGRPFGEFTVAEIAARAGVSRSTFYAHFAGVEGLLSSSIAIPFSTLVETLGTRDHVAQLQGLLEHFWAQRPMARTLLTGPMRRRCMAVLTGMIEQKLKSLGLARRGALILPPRLAAVQLGEVMLAPTAAWLAGESRCSSAALAAALSTSANATLDALTGKQRRTTWSR